MHRDLRRLLPAAEGRSEWIIAVNLDIRGFTTYAMSRDSAETALYLKKVYARIVDDYYSGSSFFKPTGDGLVVVIPFAEADFADMCVGAVDDSVRLVSAFGDMVSDEPMIRFERPNQLGVGLSAGSASRLIASRKTLDYSGRPLNAASRLLDLARPSGVVFDETLDHGGLSKGLRSQFTSERLFLHGLAETAGMDVFYTTNLTSIPERYRSPFRQVEPYEVTEEITFAEVKRRTPSFIHRLDLEPVDRTKIAVRITYPDYKHGRKATEFQRVWRPTSLHEYYVDVTRPTVRMDYAGIVEKLGRLGVPGRATVEISIAYPVLGS